MQSWLLGTSQEMVARSGETTSYIGPLCCLLFSCLKGYFKVLRYRLSSLPVFSVLKQLFQHSADPAYIQPLNTAWHCVTL